MARTTFHPLTPDRWSDFEALFGPRGACAGCWCTWWQQSKSEFDRNRGEANREMMRRRVEGGVPGILAYVDGTVAGWCAVEPRAAYARLAKSKTLAPVDEAEVWSIVCFFIARPWRRSGMSVQLLEAAVRYCRERGARAVEGYPVDPRSGKIADAFAWTGIASAFEKAGFREVARRSPTRPIMRRSLGRRRGVAPVP